MADKTKAELLAEIEELQKQLDTPTDEVVAALKEQAQDLEEQLSAKEEEIAKLKAAAPSEDVNALMKEATAKLELQELAIDQLKDKLKEAQGGGVGYTGLASIAKQLEPGTDSHPGEHRVTDDFARIATLDPWFHVEAINFRNDSGYDSNARDRAIASVERAFRLSRLGIKNGEYTAFPPFSPGNKLVIAVAIVPDRS